MLDSPELFPSLENQPSFAINLKPSNRIYFVQQKPEETFLFVNKHWFLYKEKRNLVLSFANS